MHEQEREANWPYLNVGGAERCDACDFGSRDSRRFEVEHGLQVRVQLCYSRRHGSCGSASPLLVDLIV